MKRYGHFTDEFNEAGVINAGWFDIAVELT